LLGFNLNDNSSEGYFTALDLLKALYDSFYVKTMKFVNVAQACWGKLATSLKAAPLTSVDSAICRVTQRHV